MNNNLLVLLLYTVYYTSYTSKFKGQITYESFLDSVS